MEASRPLFGRSEVVTPMLTAACKARSETIPVASKQTEAIFRVQRNHRSANDDDDEEEDDKQTGAQTKFLADNWENEIGVRVGQVEHFLAAVAESKTFHSAAAPRDQCLHLLQAIGLLIRFEIAKRSEPGHALGHPDRDQEPVRQFRLTKSNRAAPDLFRRQT